MTPEALVASIQNAEARKAQALAEYRQALAEIAWLRQGLRLMGLAEPEIEAPVVTELFPSTELFDSGVKPTLRQAIVAVMRFTPAAPWRVSDLAADLVHRGWLADTEEATKRVSDLASVMVTDGQLERLARGTYGLAPALVADFELAGGVTADVSSESSE